MPNWKVFFLVSILTLLSACNLSRTPPTAEVTLTADPQDGDGRPTVAISSPQNGDEVVVGADVFVSATATDPVGVTRVQLIVNNQIVKTVSSESVAGDPNMNVLLDWRPTEAGTATVEVIAYRGSIASDTATIDLIVRGSQSQVTATIIPQTDVPIIDPNDPTCRALTNVALNVRTGPGTSYPRITTLSAGAQHPIVGRVGDNSWWLVRVSGTTTGWVIQRNPLNPGEEFISIFGNCSGIPIVGPPPPPVTPFTPPPPPPTHTPTRTPTQPPPPTLTHTPADLVVVDIDGPTGLNLPDGGGSVSGTFSVTITNNGQASTGPFSNSIQVLPGGDIMELGVVSNLTGGQSISLSIELTFDTAGVYTISVAADNENAVAEVSEINNTGAVDVGVVAP